MTALEPSNGIRDKINLVQTLVFCVRTSILSFSIFFPCSGGFQNKIFAWKLAEKISILNSLDFLFAILNIQDILG